jgi:hypothetical protein
MPEGDLQLPFVGIAALFGHFGSPHPTLQSHPTRHPADQHATVSTNGFPRCVATASALSSSLPPPHPVSRTQSPPSCCDGSLRRRISIGRLPTELGLFGFSGGAKGQYKIDRAHLTIPSIDKLQILFFQKTELSFQSSEYKASIFRKF